VLTKLSAETGQTAAYYENTVDGVMIVAKVEHEESVHMRAVRDPINRLSHNEFGQICLAYRSEADWKRFYDIEPRSDMSFDEFKVHLNEIRKRGYLIEGTSHASWTRVTAPVFYGVGGGFAGAIGVTRPVVFSQINDLAFYRDLVVRAAHAATERLKVKESVLS
jgi:DNA-binding IclR family transcriptional regulator